MDESNLEYTVKFLEIDMNIQYGSVEHYAQQFSDWLADIQADEPHYGDNLIAGFKLALADWKNYYQKQVAECDRIEKLFDEEI